LLCAGEEGEEEGGQNWCVDEKKEREMEILVRQLTR